MKKLFGGIDLTWKKLIIFAICSGVYTAIMALLPITYETSFRDIAIQFEWWIFFGIIIISNSKSPLDSALKCFVFFLISQPLVYLIQVPFSDMGFGLFQYYRYWFIWTLLTLPMGFIGYYIKKNNFISLIILLPMLIFLVFLGVGYLKSAIDSFPHHLLSSIFCFTFIIIIVLGLFDKLKLRIITLVIALASLIGLIIIEGFDQEYETYKVLDDYNIVFEGKAYIQSFSGTSQGNAALISREDNKYTVKINGRYKGKYSFVIADESQKEYNFEYHYDKEQKTVILEYKE